MLSIPDENGRIRRKSGKNCVHVQSAFNVATGASLPLGVLSKPVSFPNAAEAVMKGYNKFIETSTNHHLNEPMGNKTSRHLQPSTSGLHQAYGDERHQQSGLNRLEITFDTGRWHFKAMLAVMSESVAHICTPGVLVECSFHQHMQELCKFLATGHAVGVFCPLVGRRVDEELEKLSCDLARADIEDEDEMD